MDNENIKYEDKGDTQYEPWYKWGVLVLYVEMLIAIGVSLYALYIVFTGHSVFS